VGQGVKEVTTKGESWKLAGPLCLSTALGMLFGRLDFTLAYGGPFLVALSNVASFWLLVAFLMGLFAISRKHAALCGAVALLAALFGFYDAWHLASASSLHLTFRVARPWVAAALLCGPFYGVMGYLWRTGRNPFAAMVVVGPFLIEPLAWYFRLHPLAPRPSVCLLESAMGVLFAWALFRFGFLSAVSNSANSP
jgi:hypothetical protein